MKRKQIIVGLGILENNNHQVLIALRNDPDHPDAHNKWELPGGGVEFGETVEETVIREMKEEVGVTVQITRTTPFIESNVRAYGDTTYQFILIAYLCKSKDEPRVNNEEIARIKWIDPRTIDQYKHLPFTDVFVKKAAQHLSSK